MADTVGMSNFWPKAKIYSFEPVKAVHSQLLANTAHLSNVTCFNLALADTIGTKDIFVSSVNTAASSLLAPELTAVYHPNIGFNAIEQVQTLTLDAWAELNNVKAIDFLWLDMQGIEPKMLQASPNMLKTVKVIYTEVNHKELYKGSILYPEYKKWLEEQGFTLVKTCFPFEDCGDALFIRK